LILGELANERRSHISIEHDAAVRAREALVLDVARLPDAGADGSRSFAARLARELVIGNARDIDEEVDAVQ